MTLRSEELVLLAGLLEEGLELSGDAREAWLAGLDSSRAQLRPLLRKLLHRQDDDVSSGILDTLPKFDGVGADAPKGAVPVELTAGSTVGPYRLIRQIGQGGMSVVWLATRTDEQLKRSVALKLPFAPLSRGKFAKRFARERDILASLTHPQIARLYDAGVGTDGQPYLAMEYVEGTPLLDHCDRHDLDIRARLSLFEQVLSAVQFAHSHLVVHRDLKPSNILVSDANRVMLLDFGIAKLLSDGTASETELTVFGGRAMTPDYASPEQIAGESLGTTSDIYSLGVILYELLTGSRPYRLKRDSRGALEEAILESDPVVPSRAISPAAAQNRHCGPAQLSRLLRGDLDTIILKALGKRPESRYPTADALAQELQRYSRGDPIEARAARPLYRVRKFLVRNALVSSLAGALLVALFVGLGAALWEAHAARVEARRAQSVKQFLVEIFSQSDPELARGKDITAGEILERGAQRLDAELRDDPEMLGELHRSLADIYMALGANVDGLAHAERSIALLEKTGQQRTEAYVHALSLRAQAFEEEERWDESTAAYKELRRAARNAFRAETSWDVMAVRGLAWAATEQGHLTEAKQLYDEALRIALRVSGENSIDYVKTLGSSIQADMDLGLLTEAHAAAAKSVALAPRIPGYTLTDQLVARYQLAATLFRERKYEESVDELKRLVPDMEHHIGPHHDRTIKARALFAQELAELGDFSQALAEQRANLQAVATSRTGDREMVALQELTFAKVLRGADRFEEGVSNARRGLEYFDSKYPAPTWLRERGRWVLGDLLIGTDHLDEAIDTLTTALKNMQTLQASGPKANVADTLTSLGNAYRLKGDSASAAREFASACDMYDALFGAESQAALRCRVYQLLVSPPDARAPDFQKRYGELASLRRRLASILNPRHPALAELDIVQSEYLARMGQGSQAAALRARAVQAYESATGVAPHIPLRMLH